MLDERRLARAVLADDGDRSRRARSTGRRRAAPRPRPGSDGRGRGPRSDADRLDVADGRPVDARGVVAGPRRDRSRPPTSPASAVRDGGLVEGPRWIHAGELRQPDQGRWRAARAGRGRSADEGSARARSSDDPAPAVEDEAAVRPPEDRRDRARRRAPPVPSAAGRRRRSATAARAGRVELGGRLVEDEHVGAHRDDAGDGDPLLLAARERERLAVGEVADAEALEHGVDPGVHRLARHAQVLEPEGELLADRQLRGRELVGRRREDDPDPPGQRRGVRARGDDPVDGGACPSTGARTTRGMKPAATGRGWTCRRRYVRRPRRPRRASTTRRQRRPGPASRRPG